jgi:hypothetical protein
MNKMLVEQDRQGKAMNAMQCKHSAAVWVRVSGDGDAVMQWTRPVDLVSTGSEYVCTKQSRVSQAKINSVR